jgi:hypothetical protein
MGSGHFVDQSGELDRVAFGDHPDKIYRFAFAGPLSASEDAEIVGAGLHGISPLTDIPVNKIAAQDIGVFCEYCKEPVEIIPFDLDLSPVEEVESFLRGEPKAFFFPAPESSLFIKRLPVQSAADGCPIKYRFHCSGYWNFSVIREREGKRANGTISSGPVSSSQDLKILFRIYLKNPDLKVLLDCLGKYIITLSEKLIVAGKRD